MLLVTTPSTTPSTPAAPGVSTAVSEIPAPVGYAYIPDPDPWLPIDDLKLLANIQQVSFECKQQY